MKKNKNINLKKIDLIVYDFDGVMTDNKVLIDSEGNEYVFCNRSDGLAISIIKKMGIPQIIISTEKDRIVLARARKIKIPVIFGVDKKDIILKNYCKKYNFNLNKTIYIGNDINDLKAMLLVGFKIAPSDANKKILEISDITTKSGGGKGVIREFLSMCTKIY